MNLLVTVFVSLMMGWACGDHAADGAAHSNAKSFGKGEFKTAPVSLASAMSDYAKYKDQKMVVTGQVKEVCAKEGCWMKIKDGDKMVRAVIKDHGFKVPAALKDKNVRAEGFLTQKELPAKVVRHYMKDEGRPQSEIDKVTGPEKVFEFTATAVEVTGA